ncbi:MAG: tRNA pseudouridine38-40 synthase [Acidimicrobiaceae bacterium]
MTLFEPELGTPAAPSGPLVRVRAKVAYDGTGYAGFAPQPRQKTVGGTLAGALEKALHHPVELTCAGRTDAGVHAWGQVVSFDAAADGFDPKRLQRSVNKMLAPSIAVRSLEAAAPGFDARFSAVSRRYRYTVLDAAVADPFLASTAWWVDKPLDLRAMRLACDPLLGEHDFASFCRVPKDKPDASLVRRVLDARWEVDEHDDGQLLRFWIEANAFCHQMVRSIVGTLVEVGLGKTRAGELTSILRAGDRAAAGKVAPPHGLCLWEVTY